MDEITISLTAKEHAQLKALAEDRSVEACIRAVARTCVPGGSVMAGQLTLFSEPPSDAIVGVTRNAGGPGSSPGGGRGHPGPRGEDAGGAFDCVWHWGRPVASMPPYQAEHSLPRCKPVGIPSSYEPQRKGRRCRVRCRGRGRGPLNVAVEMDDGELVCAPRWAVRRVS